METPQQHTQMEIWNNKHWMSKVEVNLLYRLWEKKGSPGMFSKHGLLHYVTRGDFGVIEMQHDPFTKPID